MQKSMTSILLGIIFFGATLGIIIYYFYREAVTGGISAIERLIILGPMFVLGFFAMGMAYVIGKERLKQEENRLIKFRSNFYKLVFIYGSIFLIFILWILWDLLKPH